MLQSVRADRKAHLRHSDCCSAGICDEVRSCTLKGEPTNYAPWELWLRFPSSARGIEMDQRQGITDEPRAACFDVVSRMDRRPSDVAGRYSTRSSGGACEIARPGCRRQRHSAGAGECARIKRLGQRSKRHRERGQGAGDPAAVDKSGDAVHRVAANGLPDLAGAARGEDQTHAICGSQIPPRGQGNGQGARGQGNRQRARQTARPQNSEHLPGVLSSRAGVVCPGIFPLSGFILRDARNSAFLRMRS